MLADAEAYAAWTRGLTFAFVTVTFMVYLYIGWRARVRETGGFYVAGRGVPAIANGAATAADWMSAASFLSMAGMISFMGFDGAVYLIGWTGGYVLLALLLAPYLRKFGKYTVPDFVGERYDSQAARVVAAVCAIFVSLTYVAGQMRGVGIVFSRFLEIEIWQGVVIGMVIVAFFAVLGGMKGITWTQVVQYGVLITAFVIPAVAISRELTGMSLPQAGMTFSDIGMRLDELHRELGFADYTRPFATKTQLDLLCITLCLMIGTAGLPHVIVRFYTTRSVRAARWSAGWALLFIALLYTTAPAVGMFARYNLLQTLHGAEVVRVEEGEDGREPVLHLARRQADGQRQPIPWAVTWQRTGLIRFHDANGNGQIELDRVGDGFREAVIDRDIIVLSTPEVARLSPWVVALVAAGGLAAALSTAAGLLLVISSSIAHDLYVHLIDRHAPEGRRLAVGRLMIVLAILLAGYFGIRPPGFVAQVVAFAFGLAASSFFPVIFLGIFDRRTNRYGAITGMVVGLLFTGLYILGTRSDRILGTAQPLMEPWCFGISAEGIGVVGCLLNLAVTWTVSRCTPPPPARVVELVERIRVPWGPAGPHAAFDERDIVADDDVGT